MRLLLVPAVLLALAGASTASPGAHVTLLKCCPYGETLDPHTADGPATCMRVENASESWLPKIFSKRQRSYLKTLPAHWTVHPASPPPCGARARMVPAHPHNQPVFLLFEDGSLYLHETNEILGSARFCVDSTAAIICLPKDDGDASSPSQPPSATSAASVAKANSIEEAKPVKRQRLRKCCIGDAVYSETDASCVTRASTKVAAGADLWTSAGEHLRDAFTVITGFPACRKPGFAVRGYLGDGPAPGTTPAARLEADGMVWVGGSRLKLQPDDYCLEIMVEANGAVVMACPGEDAKPDKGADLRFTWFPAMLFLSVFFLAATLLASCLLPAAYHQLHWRCQTNYVASLMLGDLFLAITQVSGAALAGPFCVVFAVLMHFLFLAAFFWLNTMCFNIWWTFRDLRPASVDKNQETVRMRLYEAYAWGGPLIIAGVAAALDRLPKTDEYEHLLRPGFGEDKCWFYGDMEILAYFFGPVGVLLLINLCLFIATARELTCGLWKADGNKPTTERATLRRVCLKLVVVMGVTWVADVVSWVAGGPQSLWLPADLVNLLQGVLIFAVVGCQPHVWSAVKRLWCLRESRSEASRRAMHLSSTSQGANSMGPESFTTTTTSNGNNTPAKLQLNGNGPATGAAPGNGDAPPPPNTETPC